VGEKTIFVFVSREGESDKQYEKAAEKEEKYLLHFEQRVDSLSLCEKLSQGA
jgi:ribosomal protein S17